MKAPRRIFRATGYTRPRVSGRTMLAGIAAVVVTGGLMMVSLPSDLLGRAAPGPESMAAAPGMVAVIDGTTLRIDGRVVRLRGISAPVRGDGCAAASDCGGAATMALAGLVRDRMVLCRLHGRDPLGRPFADCEANGADLGRAVVLAGWARAEPGEAALGAVEQTARQQGSGLWARR